MSEVKRGAKHPLWVGDEAGYGAQHQRAGPDWPDPLGQCQIPGCFDDARDRARIDHTNLVYRPELVLPMCRSHNMGHSRNHFLVLFEAGDEEVSLSAEMGRSEQDRFGPLGAFLAAFSASRPGKMGGFLPSQRPGALRGLL